MIQLLSKYKSYILTFLLIVGMIFAVNIFAAEPTRTLGFQGQFYAENTPGNAPVSATFTFYDSLTDGTVTGSPITKIINVVNGYFGTQFTEADTTGVNLDQQLYLEISVNGVTLSPRTTVNPTVSSLKSFGTFSYAVAPTVGPSGSLYFNTTSQELYVSNGTSWQLSGFASSTTQWVANGTSLNYMAGNVGIGTTTPDFALSVYGQMNLFGGANNNNILMSDVDLASSTRNSGNNIMIGAAQSPNGGAINAVIIGKGAYTGGGTNDYSNVVIGRSASIVSLTNPNGVPNAVVIGSGAKSAYGGVVVIGKSAEARGDLSIVVGEGSIASSTNAIVIGRVSTVTGLNSAIFGGDNGTLSQDNTFIYGRIAGSATGGSTAHGFGTMTPIDTSRMTIRSRYSTSSSLTLLSARTSMTNGLILGGIDFRSDDSDLSVGGTTTASILALANTTHTTTALGTDLSFNTTNGTTTSESMRILGNGNVGIGTTTPGRSLVVAGVGMQLYRSGGATPHLEIIQGGAGADLKNWRLNGETDGSFTIYPMTDTNSNLRPLRYTHDGRLVITNASGSTVDARLVIDSNNIASTSAVFLNGNVGIGTSTPSTKLSIVKSGPADPSLSSQNGIIALSNASYNVDFEIGQYNGGQFGHWMQSHRTNDSTVYPIILNPLGGNVGIGTGTTTNKLTVNGNADFSGSVAIGTTTPLGPLTVKGGASSYYHDFQAGYFNLTNGSDRRFGFAANGYGQYAISDATGVLSGGAMTLGITGSNHFIGTDSVRMSFFVSSTSSPALTLRSSGNVGVGTSSPVSKFTVAGAINSTDLLGGITTLSVDASGNIIRTPSDQKLKTNVETLTSALDKVNQMRGVSYNWIDTNRFGTSTEIGFIAQELETIVPEVVKSGGEYKSVNYQNLTALLTEAIKELSTKFTNLSEVVKTKRIETEQLCVEEVCVDKNQLKAMLLQLSQPQIIQVNSQPEPTSTPTPEPLPEPVTPPTE